MATPRAAAAVLSEQHKTVKRAYQHLALFINTYDFARRLTSLKGLTPHEFIHKQRTDQAQ